MFREMSWGPVRRYGLQFCVCVVSPWFITKTVQTSWPKLSEKRRSHSAAHFSISAASFLGLGHQGFIATSLLLDTHPIVDDFTKSRLRPWFKVWKYSLKSYHGTTKKAETLDFPQNTPVWCISWVGIVAMAAKTKRSTMMQVDPISCSLMDDIEMCWNTVEPYGSVWKEQWQVQYLLFFRWGSAGYLKISPWRGHLDYSNSFKMFQVVCTSPPNHMTWEWLLNAGHTWLHYAPCCWEAWSECCNPSGKSCGWIGLRDDKKWCELVLDFNNGPHTVVFESRTVRTLSICSHAIRGPSETWNSIASTRNQVSAAQLVQLITEIPIGQAFKGVTSRKSFFGRWGVVES